MFEKRVADAHLTYKIMNSPCRTRHHFELFHFEKVCTLQNGHVHIKYVNMLKLTYVYVQVLYVQVCWTSTCRCLSRCCFNGFSFFGNCLFNCSTPGNLAIVPSHTRLRCKAPRPSFITFGIRSAVPAVVALEAIAVVFVRLLQKE